MSAAAKRSLPSLPRHPYLFTSRAKKNTAAAISSFMTAHTLSDPQRNKPALLKTSAENKTRVGRSYCYRKTKKTHKTNRTAWRSDDFSKQICCRSSGENSAVISTTTINKETYIYIYLRLSKCVCQQQNFTHIRG